MEGFINLRIAPKARQRINRSLAIVPAVIVILLYGIQGVGELLNLSHVVLSFELPFAIVPLVMFTARRAKMGELVAPRWLTGAMLADRRRHHRAEREPAVDRCAGLTPHFSVTI